MAFQERYNDVVALSCALDMGDVRSDPISAARRELANGWGDVHPNHWNRYLPYETELTKIDQCNIAPRWDELKQENAALRVSSWS